MSEKLVTKGIVLRATATKEADYILNILTDSLGQIAVVARGARRKGSRIAAGSELLAFSELVLYQRGNWYYLDEASTISLFDGIRQDIELLSLASYFAEFRKTFPASRLRRFSDAKRKRWRNFVRKARPRQRQT